MLLLRYAHRIDRDFDFRASLGHGEFGGFQFHAIRTGDLDSVLSRRHRFGSLAGFEDIFLVADRVENEQFAVFEAHVGIAIDFDDERAVLGLEEQLVCGRATAAD